MALGGKLRILDMTFDDHANYQCIVSNSVGSKNHTILVRVKGKNKASLCVYVHACKKVGFLFRRHYNKTNYMLLLLV